MNIVTLNDSPEMIAKAMGMTQQPTEKKSSGVTLPRLKVHNSAIMGTEEIKGKNLPLTMSNVRFIKFIMDEIYPGGRLPLAAQVEQSATKAGYTVTRRQHLQPHYVKTLDTWAANLEAKKDEAIAITNDEIYERFLKYLKGCADLFRDGYTDVCQFTLEKG